MRGRVRDYPPPQIDVGGAARNTSPLWGIPFLERQMAFDPTKQAFGLLDEFKNFAFKGNVVDLAVGVIIGGAFGAVVNSVVKNIMMPLIAAVLPGQQGYAGLKFTLNGSDITYGIFIADVITFVITAFAVFVFIVKFLGFLGNMRKKKEAAAPPPPPPAPTKEELLLTEIRDILRSK
jgi:large conductance mechanosensitive channel